MTSTTQPIRRTAEERASTFAAGWNARCRNQAIDVEQTAEWLQGWRLCNAAPRAERVEFAMAAP